MQCPNCNSDGPSKCTDSRKRDNKTVRRRECLACGHRFTTYESVGVLTSPIDLKGLKNRDKVMIRHLVRRLKVY